MLFYVGELSIVMPTHSLTCSSWVAVVWYLCGPMTLQALHKTWENYCTCADRVT